MKLYQELSEVKDSLIKTLKENQDKLSIANDKLSVEKDNYFKSLKEINILNQRISMLEIDAIKYKRLTINGKDIHNRQNQQHANQRFRADTTRSILNSTSTIREGYIPNRIRASSL